MEKKNTKIYFIVILSALFVFGVIMFIAVSGGVRGSDQYWYLMDTENAINGQFRTNLYYPCLLKNGIEGLVPQPFIHNVTSVYLAAFFGFFTSAYSGFIILNVLSIILSALLLFLILKRKMSIGRSLFFTILYSFLPLTFWSASQVLAEASTSLLVMLLLYTFFNYDKKIVKWYFMMAISIILTINAITFIPLLLIIPLIMIFTEKKTQPSKIIAINTIALYIVGFCGYFLISKIFPPYYTGSNLLHTVFLTNVPGVSSNMELYNNPLKQLPEFSVMISCFFSKCLQNIKVQFIPNTLQDVLFYYSFNTISAFAVCGLWKLKGEDKKYAWTSLFFLVLFFVTIITFQNQARYIMMLLPAIYICFAMSICKFNINVKLKKAVNIFMVSVLAVCIVSDFALANFSKKDGLNAKKEITIMRETFNEYIPMDKSVLILPSSSFTLFYALSGRTTMLSSEKERAYYVNFMDANPDYVIINANSEIPDYIKEFEVLNEFSANSKSYKILKR